MYYIHGQVWAIPTYRVYRLYDYVQVYVGGVEWEKEKGGFEGGTLGRSGGRGKGDLRGVEMGEGKGGLGGDEGGGTGIPELSL